MSIQSMRDQSEGVIAKVIVGLIIVVFALFGMGSITTFLSPVPKVATVNGVDVTQAEMEVAFQRQRSILAARGQTLAADDEDRLRQNVIQGLINRKLMLQAVEDMDLGVSAKAIDDELIQTEAFKIEGAFNPQQFQIILANAGYNPTTYRSELKIDKMIGQLNAGLSKTGFLTKQEAKLSTALAQQKRDVAYLRLSREAQAESIEVSDADLEAYYDEHQDDYQTEEEVDIAYVEIKRDDLVASIEVTDEALQTFFTDTQDIYAEPERRRVAHILLLAEGEDADPEVLAKITGIKQQITDGADFAKLAGDSSEDPGSAENGGDLGFTDPGTFDEAFETAAYNLAVGEVSEPVKTQFGYHLIKVLEIEAASEPVFADVKEKVEQEYRASEAEANFIELSAQLDQAAFESADLEGPAIDLDLTVKSTGLVTRTNATGVAAEAGVLDAVLDAEVLLSGNNSALIEITPNHHIVVRSKEYKAQELKPLADVKEEIVATIKTNRAGEQVETKASEAVELLETGSIAAYVADQLKLDWQVEGGATRNNPTLDREIVSEAFKLARPAEGNKSVGYALLSNGDAVVLSVTNVQNQTADDMDLDSLATFAKILGSQQGLSDYQAFAENLEKSGNVSR